MTIWGWKFQNVTPIVFNRCQPNFMRTLTALVEYGLFSWQFDQLFKILWDFEILAWDGSQFENPKMCTLFKTTDHTVKRMKIWDLQSWELYM